MQVIGDIARLGAKRYPDKVALIMDDASLDLQPAQPAGQTGWPTGFSL